VQTRWRDARKSGNLYRSPRIDPDIDDKLLVTLGIRDRNRSRAIAKLRAACEQIQASEPTYKALEIRRSADGSNWVLSRLKEDNGTNEPLSLFKNAV
jgi:hypothetical protein